MAWTVDQRRTALRVRYGELRFWVDQAFEDLPYWRCNGAPLAVAEPWPTRDGVVQFVHPEVTVPASWPLDLVRLDLDLGGEGLVHVLYPDGSDEGFGVDPYHQRFPLQQRTFVIEAEAVSRLPFGQPVRDARLRRARLLLVDRVVERFWRQLRLIEEAVFALPEHEVAVPLLEAAERALAGLSWPSATAPYIARMAPSSDLQAIWQLPADLLPNPPGLDDGQRATVRSVADRLDQELLALRERFPPQGRIALSGHAHLDLAWLWPLDETRRKARRSYHTITGLLERYPEFRFNQSSAQVYAFVEEDDPALFSRIKEAVAAGQWEPVGGMWVEPDINMPAGESLVRQLLYGQRYFQAHFGFTHTVCWLPDCFGFSPGLPQLLRGAGINHFFTIKLTWSETNTFPYDLFWWEGLDGSRVLAHMFNNPGHHTIDASGYNGDTGPYSLAMTWKNFRGKQSAPESLLSVGYGDGGGGTTAEMIEQTRALQNFPAIPASEFGQVRDFFARLETSSEQRELPVWLGEMYLELHRGTLTTQGRTKYLHRWAERELVAAEVVTSLLHLLGGPEPASLESLWRVVLRNEFHDILPGSSIREVYQQAEAELGEVVGAAGTVSARALDGLADALVAPGDQPAILVVNPDLSARPIRIELDIEVPGAQAVEGGSVIAGGVERVPGLGASTVPPGLRSLPLTASPRRLENSLVRVELADDGTLSSVVYKPDNREVLDGRGNQLWAYVDKPAAYDAWDIDDSYRQAGQELPAPESIEIVESGPYRAAIRIVRRFERSTVQQDIRLWANSARVEFATTLDWHDRRWLLKACFPLAVRSATATFETAFGVVERPTHRNTSWDQARFEVAGHRFVDLSEPGFGVAILNDGKYGHHASGSELGISLLRSPHYPDPLADEGRQTFAYALLPHAGSWIDGDVLMEAEDLNRPLLARPVMAATSEVGQTRHIIGFDGLTLGLGTLKVLEDGGGLVLRAYEPQGARGTATLTLPNRWEADAELDLLEQETGEATYHFTPFQLHSWRLRQGS